MYIEPTVRYYNGSGEHIKAARFLILMSDKEQKFGPDNVRAIVRKVALHQCGHWMMGSTRIGKKSYTLSGAYGEDGLVMDVDKEAFEKGIPLPRELYDLWAKGGGHNSCGSEAFAMKEWACKTFPKDGK